MKHYKISLHQRNEEVLKRLLNDYAGQFANLSSNLVNLLNQQDVSQIDLSQAIDNYYHNLGQQTVITKVQKFNLKISNKEVIHIS